MVRADPAIGSESAMLPPVDHSILEANPEFASLYTKLTTSVLNPDGSTKNGPSTKERRAVTEVMMIITPYINADGAALAGRLVNFVDRS